MPKRGRHRRGGGRVTTKGTRPLSSGGRVTVLPSRSAPARGRAAEPSLVDGVRNALRTGEPLDLLTVVSTMLAAVDKRRSGRSEGVSLDTLVRSFADTDGPETTALLAVIAQLSDDEVIRDRARRELAVRRGRLLRLPAWLSRLGDSASLVGAELVHVLGDGENVMLSVRVPPTHDLTVVLYVDHNLGTLVKDGFVVPRHIEPLAKLMVRQIDDPDTKWRPLPVADAAARARQAIDAWAIAYPPIETDTWPACRPLVEWVLRSVPRSGTGYVRPEWTPAQRGELAKRFLSSPVGARHRTALGRGLVDAVLWFGADYGIGDPLLWSPARVEILLTDWIPRKVLAPADELAGAPDVLRDLIEFGHAERGIRAELTDETLEALDAWAHAYHGLLRGRPEARPASSGLDAAPHRAGLMLEALAEEVGGPSELLALDDFPLPDQDVAWDRVAADVRPRVREVAALCDRWCEEVIGADSGEYRTACRRFLTAVAAARPALFRRRAKAESGAAAVCWAVGSANDLFHTREGGLLIKDLVAYFGLSGNPSARGRTFLEAAGFGFADGGTGPVRLDARYLVSSYRRSLMADRDRYLEDDDWYWEPP